MTQISAQSTMKKQVATEAARKFAPIPGGVKLYCGSDIEVPTSVTVEVEVKKATMESMECSIVSLTIKLEEKVAIITMLEKEFQEFKQKVQVCHCTLLLSTHDESLDDRGNTLSEESYDVDDFDGKSDASSEVCSDTQSEDDYDVENFDGDGDESSEEESDTQSYEDYDVEDVDEVIEETSEEGSDTQSDYS